LRLTVPIAAAGAALLLTAAPSQTTSIPAPAAGPDSVASAAPRRLADAALLGTSGNLRAFIGLPASLVGDSRIAPMFTDLPITVPGVHALTLSAPDGEPLVAVSLAAFPAEPGARQKSYRTGRWPMTGLAAKDARYAPPAGFIPVTSENAGTQVSKRFRLRDFLTHDQQDVWPKVLVLRPTLVDKLELIGEALDARGLPSRLHVMSGFRTPQYNALGVGARGGRAGHSRHMYGDAADVFVDADDNGRMDDLDGDGRETVKDARVLFAVAESVEASHPEFVGGLSAYPANSAHGPFVHVDVRGKRARW
jgi:uncharacterized protein YcbK (DUF882 family)